MSELDNIELGIISNKENTPAAKKSAAGPMSVMDRIVIQNLFDTQPKRREAFLNKNGYEQNPSDDNEYRPTGSKSGYLKIDPGFYDEFKRGFLENKGKGIIRQSLQGVQNVKEEALKDVGDVLSNVATIAPMISKRIPGPMGVLTGFLSGAFGTVVGEGVKEGVGDLFLDKNIPTDKAITASMAILNGAGGEILRGGGKLLKEGKDVWIKSRINRIKAAAEKGGLTPELADKIVKNPENFSEESVKGAGEKMREFFRGFFGTENPKTVDLPEYIPKEGTLGKAMALEVAKRNSELSRLSKEPAANFSYKELADPILSKYMELESKLANGSITADEELAMSYIEKKLKILKDKTFGGDTSKSIPIDKARSFLDARQSEIYSNSKSLPGETSYGRALLGAFGGKDGLLSVVNEKAKSVGSDLPGMNMKISKMLNAYNVASDKINENNVFRAFIGKDSDANFNINLAAKNLDESFGTNLSPMLSDKGTAAAIEKLYETQKGFAAKTAGNLVGEESAAKRAAIGLVETGSPKKAYEAIDTGDVGSAISSIGKYNDKLKMNDAVDMSTISAPAAMAAQIPAKYMAESVSKVDVLPDFMKEQQQSTQAPSELDAIDLFK